MLRQKKSKNQEVRLAKSLAGRRQVASGALPFAKGDVLSESFLVECKRTDKKQYTIKLDELDKILREATKVGKDSLMQIEIGNRRFFLLEEYVFHSLIGTT